jgi:cytoplasmic iron level regulating protein YaaA (DUF328/UPF0246 family)
MKILLSPSKTMNLDNAITPWSQPIYKKQAGIIHKEIQKLSVNQLKVFYKISDSLANRVVEMIHTKSPSFAAIGYYKGEAYRYLDFDSMNKNTLNNAQASLRVLCAKYGYLKPFDAITPYRMDFLVNFEHLGLDNGYTFWKSNVTDALFNECLDSEFVFNLASKEFASVVDKDIIQQKCHWIDVDFLSETNGNLKTVSMIAKKARGLYARALIENPIDTMDNLFMIESFDDFVLDKSNSHPNYLRYISKKK